MTLQISQYSAIGHDSAGTSVQVPFGPPVAVDNRANGQSLTIGGDANAPRLVRFLAKGSDHDVVWTTDSDGETFKEGVPEYRALVLGTVITVAAAS